MAQIKEKNVVCEICFCVRRFPSPRTQRCQLPGGTDCTNCTFQKATAYLAFWISSGNNSILGLSFKKKNLTKA